MPSLLASSFTLTDLSLCLIGDEEPFGVDPPLSYIASNFSFLIRFSFSLIILSISSELLELVDFFWSRFSFCTESIRRMIINFDGKGKIGRSMQYHLQFEGRVTDLVMTFFLVFGRTAVTRTAMLGLVMFARPFLVFLMLLI